jgi:tRNA nucleotidyltransferase (CCA-adding enzyme)
VGGYIRDYFLGHTSKDIDIELYGIASLEMVENLLKEFGEVNSVGKSFGVVKLKYENLEIDFSLPRKDSKVSAGHKGFQVLTDANLDFATAASRRDFKMNAIGYDIFEKKIIDPFDGRKDIAEKRISAVEAEKFQEDPLRILRAVQFAARLAFRLDRALFELCKNMLAAHALDELPQERIYEEIKKLLLKSQKPSLGFTLLKQLESTLYFSEFDAVLPSLDFLALQNIEDEKKLTLMFSLLCLHFKKEALCFLQQLTKHKILLHQVDSFREAKKSFDEESLSDYAIYSLATQVEIDSFLSLLDALYLGKKQQLLEEIRQRALALGVLYKKAPPLIQGKDLIALGLKPSKEFSWLLKRAYTAQLHSKFSDKKEALKWLKSSIE